jgi:DNA-binding CsgD family transcriptional regulator
MKSTTAVSYVRQLCCLGLGGQAIMPGLLKALHCIVPSDSNGFFWVDKDLAMTQLYAEKLLPPEVMRLYFEQFYNKREATKRFSDLVKSHPDVHSSVFSDEFYRSDYYNLVWRHLDAHHVMYAVVRERGRPLGLLSIYRSAKDPPFTAQDEDRISGVLHYVAHGLAQRPNASATTYHGNNRSGLIILDSRGNLKHASPEGSRLLFLATHPTISSDTVRCSAQIPPALAAICRDLAATFHGQLASPPVLHHQNPWGRFVFRAYWMEGERDSSAGLIGVVIEHEEPLELKLLTRMRELPLSTMQKEVSLALATNLKNTEIAQKLNITLNTVSYHVKAVYDKLGVHGRGELVERLMESRRAG